MAILTYSARILLAQYMMTHPLHLAIGTGKESWDEEVEPPEYDATRLINEVGRKKITRWLFVNEDDDGEIHLPGKRHYSYSEIPTRHVYMEFDFDYEEGIDVAIREVGVFADTQVKSGLPASQTYFTPDQIVSKGTLITLEHLEVADRFTPNRRGIYGTVLSI